MKRLLAGAVTVVLLASAIWFRSPVPSRLLPAAADPVACVDRMFLAAARGDIETYLASFAGEERQAMQRSLSQEAAASAAASLRGSVAELKGWAVVNAPNERDAGTRCSLIVERVYASRVDRQRMELTREAAGWRITRVDRSQPAEPVIPYGTPVSALEPAHQGWAKK